MGMRPVLFLLRLWKYDGSTNFSFLLSFHLYCSLERKVFCKGSSSFSELLLSHVKFCSIFRGFHRPITLCFPTTPHRVKQRPTSSGKTSCSLHKPNFFAREPTLEPSSGICFYNSDILILGNTYAAPFVGL